MSEDTAQPDTAPSETSKPKKPARKPVFSSADYEAGGDKAGASDNNDGGDTNHEDSGSSHKKSGNAKGKQQGKKQNNAGGGNHKNRGGKQNKNNKGRSGGGKQGASKQVHYRGDTITLEDGSTVRTLGLELGDLPAWGVLRSPEELEGVAEEYLGTEDVSNESEHENKTIDFNDVYTLPLPELKAQAKALGLEIEATAKRFQIVRSLFKHAGENQQSIRVEGVLEIMEGGCGLIVAQRDNFRIGAFATFVPKPIIKKYGLLRGHNISVLAHPPRDGETAPYALRLETVMGAQPEALAEITPFTELTPYYPLERIFLETGKGRGWDNLSMRLVDILTPIGLGQRGLIVAPPRTGKTVLMQAMANSILENRPDVHLTILLIDERPEEVTDFKRQVDAEVVASTFDEAADSHIHAAEMVIEKSRRMVEQGQHVVVLLDSITRLARAYNTQSPNTGKVLSGGVEAGAMQLPKRFFGSARNIEGGGSLTILATALVETGSRMDEVIFEEFKGTGNMELNLDRELSNKRIFPAISFEQSGTRKEELLYHKDELEKIYALRRAMKGVPSTEAMEMLIKRVKKTENNIAFLNALGR